MHAGFLGRWDLGGERSNREGAKGGEGDMGRGRGGMGGRGFTVDCFLYEIVDGGGNVAYLLLRLVIFIAVGSWGAPRRGAGRLKEVGYG